MKPFKNKLAVTIVVLSVAFLGIIIFSLKNNSNIISSGVGSVISPLQKIIYNANDKLKESFDFFINFSKVKQENKELAAKNAELENQLIEYNRMKDENTRLREMFNYSEAHQNYNYLGCNIDSIKRALEKVAVKGRVEIVPVSDKYSVYLAIINGELLADLYDELTMPVELRRAHQANDKAVMQAYGFWGKINSESECVAELMKMYKKLTEK